MRKRGDIDLINIGALVEKSFQREVKRCAYELDISAAKFIQLAIKEKIERMKAESKQGF